MNIVFMGTPDFAVPCLKRLIDDAHNVIAVFTQPDKPKGRGHSMSASPVKLEALANNIPIYQPITLKNGEALEILKNLNPDLIVVVAYGKILPKDIIEFPKFGCINIHASLLPKYRGAAPIQWAVLNGDKVTGVTSMKMDVGVDTGDMLIKAQTEIGENETTAQLWDRLSDMGAQVMSQTIEGIMNDTLTPQKQDDRLSSHASMLTKDLCAIDWSNSAKDIHNQIRGLNSWPGATSTLGGKRIKIHNSALLDITYKADCGEIVENSGRLVVACGDGKCIEILVLQAEGKKAMPAADYLRGFKVEKGTKLS